MTPASRILRFDAVRNFRDFGGYASRHGGRVRAGRLYRSGHHADASDADLARLAALSIHVQADLRRPDEREKQISRFAAPVLITHDGGREEEAPHVRFLTEVGVDADMADDWMTEYYRAAPFKPHHVDMFAGWFNHIAGLPGDAAALVNCAAGKDRTGILCALTHHVLGVTEADIVADYELTNVAVDVEAFLPQAAAYFNDMLGKTYDFDVFRPFMGVRPKYLKAAFSAIAAQAGSVDDYVTDILGIDQAMQQTIRARLIEA